MRAFKETKEKGKGIRMRASEEMNEKGKRSSGI